MIPQKQVTATLNHYPFNRLPRAEFGAGYSTPNKTLECEIFCQAKWQKYQFYLRGYLKEVLSPAHKFERDDVPTPLIFTCHTNFKQPQSLNEPHPNNIIIFQATSKRHNLGRVRKVPDSVC